MPELKDLITLPEIDLSTALPWVALVVIAVVVLIVLLVLSIIRSKAAAVGVLALVVAAGGSVITQGLGALTGLVLAVGGVLIVGVLVLNRNADLLYTLRDVIKPTTTLQPPSPWQILESPKAQPKALPAPRSKRRSGSKIPGGWL